MEYAKYKNTEEQQQKIFQFMQFYSVLGTKAIECSFI